MYTRRKESNGSHLGEELPQVSTTHVLDTGDSAEGNIDLPLRGRRGDPRHRGDWLIEKKFIVETDGTMEAFQSLPAPSN